MKNIYYATGEGILAYSFLPKECQKVFSTRELAEEFVWTVLGKYASVLAFEIKEKETTEENWLVIVRKEKLEKLLS